MRTAACKVDVAVRPPQARVSQAKLFVLWKKIYLFLLACDCACKTAFGVVRFIQ